MVRRLPSARLISVVVPLRGEAAPDEAFFAPLRNARAELLVAADATTSERSLAAYEAFGARVLRSAAPRGMRLREAASLAGGDVLLFLHADTELPAGWTEMVEHAVASGAVGGAFCLSFASGGPRMAWVAFWANIRTRFTRVPYGDQAPFVLREVYERIGGHRPWPLMDDYDLALRLRKEGRIALLGAPVRTSPRRYLERGVLDTVLQNWRTLARYRKGASPEDLAADYRRSS